MQYVKQQLTEFVSSNLTDIYDEWSPTKTYTVETDNNSLTNASMARYGAFYYRSVTENNINFNPLVYENIKWVKHSVSNKFAMLDMSANSKSEKIGGDIVVTFLQNQAGVIGVGNYEADSILVEILGFDGTTVIWSSEAPTTLNSNIYDYWDYIYEPYPLHYDSTAKIALPVVGLYVRITFKKLVLTGKSSCGYLILGTPVDMGKSLMGVKFEYNSYATKEVTSFGNLEIKKGAVQDLVDFETVISSRYLPRMRRELKKIYNEIVLFIVDERDNSDYENLMTFGVIQDASVLLENSVESVMTFSILEAV